MPDERIARTCRHLLTVAFALVVCTAANASEWACVELISNGSAPEWRARARKAGSCWAGARASGRAGGCGCAGARARWPLYPALIRSRGKLAQILNVKRVPEVQMSSMVGAFFEILSVGRAMGYPCMCHNAGVTVSASVSDCG